ncbi:MAG: HAD family hydrolase [Clostridiaceae bacterium]|nr:HAD family hydrolase [Clostridiaceae bacterium]
MKYDGIVIYSDLDGTLLDSERKLSKVNMDAINYFISQGGRFGVATGRMERTTEIMFPDLKLNVPSIFFNGAMAYDTSLKKVLFKTVISGDLEPVLKKFISEYPEICCEINIHGKAYVFNPNHVLQTQLEREGILVEEARWEDIPDGWIKVLFMGDHGTLEKIKADFDKLGRTDLNIVFSEDDILDIMEKSASKGSALSKLKSLYGENWRFVVAIGDNDNDMELVQTADLGIAVGNASPAVKKASDFIIKDHNTPCIPQVLELLESYL